MGPFLSPVRSVGAEPVWCRTWRGGHYLPNKDTIYIYQNPSPGITELVVHELGHRLYFRKLSAEDRANFDHYYGEVAAVSSYGAKASAEDFARCSPIL